MERLLKSILTIREIKFRMDDDYVDRLNRQYTIIILICFNDITYLRVKYSSSLSVVATVLSNCTGTCI